MRRSFKVAANFNKRTQMALIGLFLALFYSHSFAIHLPEGQLKELLAQALAFDEGQMNPAPGSYFPAVPEALSPQADKVQSLAEYSAKLYRVRADLFEHADDLGETLAYLEIEVLKAQAELVELRLLLRPELKLVIEELMARNILTYSQLRGTSSALYEHMIRYVDRLKPGPHSPTVKSVVPLPLPWAPETLRNFSLYHPNFRSSVLLGESERENLYIQMANDFFNNSNMYSPQRLLTPGEFEPMLASKVYDLVPGSPILRPGVLRFEYIVDQEFSIKVTESTMGHLLLGKSLPVLAGGQIVLIVDSELVPRYAIISNSSGNYKPEVQSVKLVDEILRFQFSDLRSFSDFQSLMLTTGEPLSHQALKIFLRAKGLEDSDTAKQRIHRLKAEITALTQESGELLPRSTRICGLLLNAEARSRQ